VREAAVRESEAAAAEMQARIDQLTADLEDAEFRAREAHRLAREEYESEIAASLAEAASMDEQIEAARVRAREEYQAVFDSMSEIVVVHDFDGRIMFANRAGAEAAGTTLDGLVGRSCLDVWRPQGATFEVCPGLTALQSGESSAVEIASPDGRVLLVEGDILRTEDGRVIGAIETAVDITGVERRQGMPDQDVAFLQTLLDGIPNPVFVTDPAGRCYGCNMAFAQGVLGLPRPEVVGAVLSERVPDELVEVLCRASDRVLHHGGEEAYEETITRADGTHRTYAFRKEAHRDAAGQVVGIITAMLDISGLQAAQRALEQEREHTASLLSRAPAIIVEIAPNGTTSAVYGACAEVLGYEPDELVGRNWWKTLCPGALYDQLENVIGAMRAGLELEDRALVMQRKDGEQRTVSWTTANVRDENQELAAIFGVGYDITERAQSEALTEHRLNEAIERVKKLRCLSNVMRLVDDADLNLNEILAGVVASLPPALRYPHIASARVSVWDREREAGDASGLPVATMSADIVVNTEVLGSVEVRYHEPRPDVSEGPFTSEERDLLDLVAERIAQAVARRSAEESLAQQLQFRHTLIDQANVWLMALDRNRNVMLWNRTAEQISGYPREEVVGHDEVWELLYPDPHYRSEVLSTMGETVLSSRVIENWETIVRRKDGREVVVSWNARRLIDDDGSTIGTVATGRTVPVGGAAGRSAGRESGTQA